jgi:ankyrin repeat protein
VNVLLERPGIRLEQTNNKDVCALFVAALKGHADIVNALLNAGADVNFGHPISGHTALTIASVLRKLDVVNVLLKHPGIRLEQTNNIGMNALAYATSFGYPDVVARLIEFGASVTSLE